MALEIGKESTGHRSKMTSLHLQYHSGQTSGSKQPSPLRLLAALAVQPGCGGSRKVCKYTLNAFAGSLCNKVHTVEDMQYHERLAIV